MRALLGLPLLIAFVGCPDDDFRRPPPPEPVVSTVTLLKDGDGRGSLRALPAGAVCDVDCESSSFAYEDVDALDVVAEPSRNANFRRLRCTAGDEELVTDVPDTPGGDEATLTLPTIVDGVGQDWSCTATFILVHTLQVVATPGTGSGRVRGTLSSVIGADEPRRVDCGSAQTCVAAYFDGEEETLTATADAAPGLRSAAAVTGIDGSGLPPPTTTD